MLFVTTVPRCPIPPKLLDRVRKSKIDDEFREWVLSLNGALCHTGIQGEIINHLLPLYTELKGQPTTYDITWRVYTPTTLDIVQVDRKYFCADTLRYLEDNTPVFMYKGFDLNDNIGSKLRFGFDNDLIVSKCVEYCGRSIDVFILSNSVSKLGEYTDERRLHFEIRPVQERSPIVGRVLDIVRDTRSLYEKLSSR